MAGFHIIDRALQEWTGAPVTLAPNQGVKMSQTPNGKLVLALLNQSKTPNEGLVSITTGGSPPRILTLGALENAPTLEIADYAGNNVNITNISSSAPIWVSLYGPGFGNPQPLPDDGQPVALPVYQSYQFISNPNFMRLTVTAPGEYSVFVAYIGSEPGSYVVNAPDKDSFPVVDYTRVTSENQLSLTGNWLGKTVYLANLSPIPTQNPEATLVNL